MNKIFLCQRASKRGSLLALIGLLCLQTSAQLTRDYTLVKQSDPWLTCENAAALARYNTSSIAQAELALTSAKGGFVNYYDSPDVLQVGAAVESFYRISKRTVVFGKMSYDNKSGNDMAGSAFIDHEHRPFDIVEDSLTNLGRKRLDTYHLTGSFSTLLYKGFAIGAKLDYTAANYAKYKDLRHKNKLMDMKLSAGFYLPVTHHLAVAACYRYRRNNESVSFSTVGSSDKVYKSLVDLANFTGYVEQFGFEGFTDRVNEMPLVNNCHGGSAQLSIDFARSTMFFVEAGFVHRTGYYGRKSPYTITYTNHHSDNYQLKAQLSHKAKSSTYQADFYLDTEKLTNEANTYREAKKESGATYYEYFTPVKTADKVWSNYGLALTANLNIQGELPCWILRGGFNRMERRQTAYIYPYARRQNIHATELYVTATHQHLTKHGVWSAQLGGSFNKGGGMPYEDFTLASPSDKQSAPPSMDAYLYREHQYLTSAQYVMSAQLKYAFIIRNTKLRPHVKFDINHRRCNEPNDYSDGSTRTVTSVAIGCTF